ncbi:hypothetical protein FRB94_009344 [Tulasnella sp. JGI-2019a]|nr:hypothetical protein FRB94_009344 [Tulasnella sp. JGI-2019a]
MSVSVGNKGVESDENEPKCNADGSDLLWVSRRCLINEEGRPKLPSIKGIFYTKHHLQSAIKYMTSSHRPAVTGGDPSFGLGFDKLFPIQEGNPTEGAVSKQQPGGLGGTELLRSEPYPATNSRWLPAAESSNVFIQSGVTLHNREGSGKDLAAVVDMDSDEEAPPPRKKRIIPAQQPEKPTNSLREHTSSALSTRLLEEQREAAIKLWTERFRHTPPTSRKQIAE